MNGSVSYEGAILSGNISINAGANLEELTADHNGVYLPSQGKDGFSKVTVDVPEPVLDSITITMNGNYTPPSGTDGYDNIQVEVPIPEPVLDSISITTNGRYTPPSGVDGYDDILVNVVNSPIFNLYNKKIADAGGSYIMTNFDINIDEGKSYVISVYDPDQHVISNTLFTAVAGGSSFRVSGIGTASYTLSSIGLSSYGGSFRPIYAIVSEVDIRAVYPL